MTRDYFVRKNDFGISIHMFELRFFLDILIMHPLRGPDVPSHCPDEGNRGAAIVFFSGVVSIFIARLPL